LLLLLVVLLLLLATVRLRLLDFLLGLLGALGLRRRRGRDRRVACARERRRGRQREARRARYRTLAVFACTRHRPCLVRRQDAAIGACVIQIGAGSRVAAHQPLTTREERIASVEAGVYEERAAGTRPIRYQVLRFSDGVVLVDVYFTVGVLGHQGFACVE